MRKFGLLLAAAILAGVPLATPCWAVDRTIVARLTYSQRPFYHQEPRYEIKPWRYEFDANGG